MNLIKQDVGVWVNEEDGLPLKYPACIQYDGGGAPFYETADSDADITDNSNIVHWLKPIKQVYVLTEDELEFFIKDTASKKKFLNSITNK